MLSKFLWATFCLMLCSASASSAEAGQVLFLNKGAFPLTPTPGSVTVPARGSFVAGQTLSFDTVWSNTYDQPVVVTVDYDIHVVNSKSGSKEDIEGQRVFNLPVTNMLTITHLPTLTAAELNAVLPFFGAAGTTDDFTIQIPTYTYAFAGGGGGGATPEPSSIILGLISTSLLGAVVLVKQRHRSRGMVGLHQGRIGVG